MSRPIVGRLRVPAMLAILAMGARAQNAPAGGAPEPAEQERVLRAVTDFAQSYIERLPDFTCIRRSEHFRRKPSADWELQVKVAEELSYYHHDEHYKVVAVNGTEARKVPFQVMAAGYYANAGNFGHLLAELFDPKAEAQFQWQAWEDLRGKPAYVFSYHVAPQNSASATGRCVSWILFQRCRSVRFGYHGLVYISREAPRVMRITQVAEDVPQPFPAPNDSVDYDPVTVAGVEYLLPVAEEAQSQSGKTYYRNRSTYEEYHKFLAESTMTTGAPLAETAPRAATPSVVDEEPLAGHCFELRDRAARKKLGHLEAGALAAAFNDRAKAEAELQAVIRTATDPADAAHARALLAAMYARAGQDRRALAEIDRIPAQGVAPEDAVRDARARLAPVAQFPEQSVAARGVSRVSGELTDDKLTVPVRINGKRARFAMDTGAALSVVGETAAHALGIDIRGDRFEMSDAAAQKLACRAGLAASLEVGSFQLRNVVFCVLPDDQPGFSDVPEMERGLLGLPVLLALGTIRWTSDGTVEIGGSLVKRDMAKSNLCLDAAMPVLQASMGAGRLRLELDTGNPETFLYREFGEDFPDAVKGAEVGTYALEGLGESVTAESRNLPRLDLVVAGQPVSIEKVAMVMETAGPACLSCSGNAGLDLFHGARRVTLDFQAMRVTLEK